jgi:hypothetical protein
MGSRNVSGDPGNLSGVVKFARGLERDGVIEGKHRDAGDEA